MNYKVHTPIKRPAFQQNDRRLASKDGMQATKYQFPRLVLLFNSLAVPTSPGQHPETPVSEKKAPAIPVADKNYENKMFDSKMLTTYRARMPPTGGSGIRPPNKIGGRFC